MLHSFICGHEFAEPRNMGRGAARQKRLASWFDRRCLACAIDSASFQIRRFTDIRGMPLQESVYAEKIAARIAVLRRTY